MAGKTPKANPVSSINYIFEITDFEPTYMLSVNPGADDENPWWEHASLGLSTVCRHPETIAGRPAAFELAADRAFWSPSELRHRPGWQPLGVGMLELTPRGGRFYASIPHDSLSMFLTAFANGLFRFIVLNGPPLRRGKSLCTSFEFKRAMDPADA